ncbi:MAG TPA: hypothetical protein DIC56_22035 [Rhizobium sp.]|nr:hypothetical protein [Rhizobium sp.]
MTLATFDTTDSRVSRRHVTISEVFRPLSAAAGRVNRWHRRRLDERAMEAMPFDLRKDLGWPAAPDGEARGRSA